MICRLTKRRRLFLHGTRSRRTAWRVAAAACVVCVLAHASGAQTQIDYSPAARTDGYGNARPVYQRVPLAVPPQKVTRHRALRPYGWDTASVNRRGLLGSLTLPGDVFSRSAPRARSTVRSRGPLAAPSLTSRQRRALGRFGGFSQRARRSTPADLPSMFERRYALVAATSLNAPVYRSLLKPSAGFGLASTLARMPPARPSETDNVLAPLSSLDRRLQAGVALVQARQRAEGWAWFHEGEFRRAARAFESVTLLEPQDTESRIGELFCHLSVEAVRGICCRVHPLGRSARRWPC